MCEELSVYGILTKIVLFLALNLRLPHSVSQFSLRYKIHFYISSLHNGIEY